MLGELFGRCNFGRRDNCRPNSSCDVMWIVIVLMIVFKGGFFGLDICTLVILFIIFGKEFLCNDRKEQKCC